MSASSTDQGLPVSLQVAATGSVHTAGLAVDVRSARKTYSNGLRALEPIDLQVRGGDFATLLGPSGCGKSTLLRMMGGLSSPTTGSVVLWRGSAADVAVPGEPARPSNDRRAPSARHRNLGLAFVFQSPTLMPWASVERNVRLPLDLAGTDDGDAPKVSSALELVGLQEFRSVFPRELSGGMQMRASIEIGRAHV